MGSGQSTSKLGQKNLVLQTQLLKKEWNLRGIERFYKKGLDGILILKAIIALATVIYSCIILFGHISGDYKSKEQTFFNTTLISWLILFGIIFLIVGIGTYINFSSVSKIDGFWPFYLPTSINFGKIITWVYMLLLIGFIILSIILCNQLDTFYDNYYKEDKNLSKKKTMVGQLRLILCIFGGILLFLNGLHLWMGPTEKQWNIWEESEGTVDPFTEEEIDQRTDATENMAKNEPDGEAENEPDGEAEMTPVAAKSGKTKKSIFKQRNKNSTIHTDNAHKYGADGCNHKFKEGNKNHDECMKKAEVYKKDVKSRRKEKAARKASQKKENENNIYNKYVKKDTNNKVVSVTNPNILKIRRSPSPSAYARTAIQKTASGVYKAGKAAGRAVGKAGKAVGKAGKAGYQKIKDNRKLAKEKNTIMKEREAKLKKEAAEGAKAREKAIKDARLKKAAADKKAIKDANKKFKDYHSKVREYNKKKNKWDKSWSIAKRMTKEPKKPELPKRVTKYEQEAYKNIRSSPEMIKYKKNLS